MSALSEMQQVSGVTSPPRPGAPKPAVRNVPSHTTDKVTVTALDIFKYMTWGGVFGGAVGACIGGGITAGAATLPGAMIGWAVGMGAGLVYGVCKLIYQRCFK